MTTGGTRRLLKKPPAAAKPGKAAKAFDSTMVEGGENDSNSQRSFEEWMKIAADNNINTGNTWNLALIDYFHDMSVLRDKEGGNSIDFQKASCTLDGCVKIYTSRVDSVDAETRKLLQSLVCRSNETIEPSQAESDEKQRIKAKSHKHTKTLVEDASELEVKNLESDFNVDPLFKKTAAGFDEGGATGLLLNHLMVSCSGRILFDSSDDLSALHQEAPAELGSIAFEALRMQYCGSLAAMMDRQICPTFASFRFDGDSFDLPSISIEYDTKAYDEYVVPSSSLELPSTGPDDDGDMAYDGYDGVNEDEDVGFDISMVSNFPLPSESQEALSEGTMLDSTADPVFAYFDSNVMRNWAGPEYWKKRSLRVAGRSIATAPSITRKPRAVAPKLNFMEPLTLTRAKILAPPARPNLMPKLVGGSTASKQSKFLLPEDLRVTSNDFLTYFLKPGVKIGQLVARPGSLLQRMQSESNGDNALESFNSKYLCYFQLM